MERRFEIGDEVISAHGETFVIVSASNDSNYMMGYSVDGRYPEFPVQDIRHLLTPVCKLEKTGRKYDVEGFFAGTPKETEEIWNLARKVSSDVAHGGFTCRELKEIFGNPDHMYVLGRLSASEVLKRYRTYEEKRAIVVGDEVYVHALEESIHPESRNRENYGIVTGVYPTHFELLMKNGDTTSFDKDEVDKTGRHFDIEALLSQLGEDDMER